MKHWVQKAGRVTLDIKRYFNKILKILIRYFNKMVKDISTYRQELMKGIFFFFLLVQMLKMVSGIIRSMLMNELCVVLCHSC